MTRRGSLAGTAIAVAMLGGAAGHGLTRDASAASSAIPRGSSVAGVVTSLDLSSSDRYDSLAVVAGRLILSGGPDGSLFASASIASTPHVPSAAGCRAAVVNPATLELSDLRGGDCEDPGL